MLKNKIVIITGASSGIGQACAWEFARRGAKVVLAARSIDKLQHLENELIAKGYSCLSVPTDVTIQEDCRRLIEVTVEKFEKIDILINNAGLSMRARFIDVHTDVLKKLMDVNFWGTVYCTQYALPYIAKTKGSIVGVSSIAGFHGLPGRTGYSASKFAMQGFLETIRIEHLKDGVHVLIAAPGFTSSNVRNAALTADGTPQGYSPRNEKHMMQPEEVARKIYLGIKYKRRNIIISWTGKFSVLLQRLIPRTLDKIFYNEMKNEPDSPFK